MSISLGNTILGMGVAVSCDRHAHLPSGSPLIFQWKTFCEAEVLDVVAGGSR